MGDAERLMGKLHGRLPRFQLDELDPLRTVHSSNLRSLPCNVTPCPGGKHFHLATPVCAAFPPQVVHPVSFWSPVLMQTTLPS